MLFRPNFCANCGIRVERPEWLPWTSRRFCVVCEVEFKGQELLPRVVVGVGLIFGILGLGSFFSSPPKQQDLQALKQVSRIADQPSPIKKALPETVTPQAAQTVPANVSGQQDQRNLSSTKGLNSAEQHSGTKIDVDEPARFCGAETKKGTPCSRRVKGSNRCFQHIGMPAMAVTNRSDAQAQK